MIDENRKYAAMQGAENALIHIRMIDPDALRAFLVDIRIEMDARPEIETQEYASIIARDIATMHAVASLRDKLGGMADLKDEQRRFKELMDRLHARDSAGVDPAGGDRPDDLAGEAPADRSGDHGDGRAGEGGAEAAG